MIHPWHGFELSAPAGWEVEDAGPGVLGLRARATGTLVLLFPPRPGGRNAGEVFARWVLDSRGRMLGDDEQPEELPNTPLRVLALGAAIEHRGTPQARWYLLGQDALWLPLLGASPCSVDASRVELVALLGGLRAISAVDFWAT